MTTLTTKTKAYRAQVKALDDDADGTTGRFEAIVSVFGNRDLHGDVVDPGAFANSLDEWAASGDPIPVVWSHDWGDPMKHLGVVEKAEETDEGLRVVGALDVDDNPVAAQVHRLMKRRSVREFSFAYDVRDYEVKRADDDDDREVMHLKELGIIEVGPTLKGANPETRLVDAKTIADAFGIPVDLVGAKRGRVLSQKNERSLRDAVSLIQSVLASVETDDEDDDDGASARDDDDDGKGGHDDDDEKSGGTTSSAGSGQSDARTGDDEQGKASDGGTSTDRLDIEAIEIEVGAALTS